MARIVTANSIVGIGTGSTWGTAVNATDRLKVISISVDESADVKQTRNHDTGNFVKRVQTGARNIPITITCALTAGGEWLKLYAGLAGTASTPAEQTASQGDYLSTLDVATSHSIFFTLAYKAEDDVVEEIPSLKLSSCQITGGVNDGGTVTFQGIADQIKNSSTEVTIAELDALTAIQDDEEYIFNGTNVYARYGDYSTGTSLSSSDDQEMVSFSYTLSRPIQPHFATRGADTDKTLEPYLSGISTVDFSMTLAAIDDSKADFRTDLNSQTEKMAELFVDGEAITATSVNASLKLQLPSLKVTGISGYGIGGQSTLQQPQATMRAQTPSGGAPSGMSGLTGYPRLTTIDERSTAWV